MNISYVTFVSVIPTLVHQNLDSVNNKLVQFWWNKGCTVLKQCVAFGFITEWNWIEGIYQYSFNDF